MKKGFSKVLLALTLMLVIVSGNMTKVNAEPTDSETLEINQTLTFTGLETPGYTFESSMLTRQDYVETMEFDITIDLPLEGDVSWNDWCGNALAVRVGDTTNYYDFGGAEVGWGVDMTGDDNPDTGGKDTESWVGTVEDGAAKLVVPINARDFAVDFYDNCWETETDVEHYTINSATAIFSDGAEEGEEATEDTPEETTDAVETTIPAFDPNGTYMAYLSVQSENFIFRNQWADTAFGPGGSTWDSHSIGDNFNGLTGWDGPDAVAYDGTFTDTEIKGNGTYQVSLTDFDFGNDEMFNMLYISTDIPMEGNPVTFTDVKVIFNGSTKYTFDQGVIPGIDTKDEKDYYEVHCINIWNNDQLGGKEGLFANMIPGSEIVLEFTVNGFDYDKVEEVIEEVVDSEDVTPEEVVPEDTDKEVAPEDTKEESTTNWGIIVAIVAAVVIIVVVVVGVMKNKKK